MYLATQSVAHTDAAHPLPGPGLFFAICGMDDWRVRYLDWQIFGAILEQERHCCASYVRS